MYYLWIKFHRSPVTAHGDPVGPPGPQNVKDMRFLRLETSLYTTFYIRGPSGVTPEHATLQHSIGQAWRLCGVASYHRV